MSRARAQLRVQGRVQGVGFRYFAYQRARNLGLTGWVRNEPDGSVSAVAEGERQDIESFADELKRGPSSASVSDVDIQWRDYSGQFDNFEISMQYSS